MGGESKRQDMSAATATATSTKERSDRSDQSNRSDSRRSKSKPEMTGCVFGWAVVTVPRLPVGELFHTGIVVWWDKEHPRRSLVCHFGPFGDPKGSSVGVRIEPIGVAWKRTMIADGKIFFNRKLRLSASRIRFLQLSYTNARKDRQRSAIVDLNDGSAWHLWRNNCQDFTRNLFSLRVQRLLVTQLDRDYLLYLAGCLRPLGTGMDLIPRGRYVLTAWDKMIEVT
jgi:hypothetical protein